MICAKCKKQIGADEARHCGDCGNDYCAECADGLCDCTGELRYYS